MKNKRLFLRQGSRLRKGLGWIPIWLLLVLNIPSEAQSETVDGIVAVVGEEVITLTDVKIARDFGLLDLNSPGRIFSFNEVLQGLIDQKVILGMAGETLAYTPPELENALEAYLVRLGRSKWELLLGRYDLSPEDFKQILQDTRLRMIIVQQKFSREAIVSLKEIESYYQGVYLQRARIEGREPLAMTDVLDEIESAIKAEKNRSRIREWIGNLRKQTEIQIFSKKFPAYFTEEDNKTPASDSFVIRELKQ